MPANQIKHDVRNGKGSEKSLEKDWDSAKDIVKDEYGTADGNWGAVQKIYQNKRDASVTQATARLKATANLENDGTDSDDPQDFASQVFDAEGMNAGRGGFLENK